MQDSGTNANGTSTNRDKLVFGCGFFLLIMGGVCTFLISGYRFRNELIGAKGTSCAKINTPVSVIAYIKK